MKFETYMSVNKIYDMYADDTTEAVHLFAW